MKNLCTFVHLYFKQINDETLEAPGATENMDVQFEYLLGTKVCNLLITAYMGYKVGLHVSSWKHQKPIVKLKGSDIWRV